MPHTLSRGTALADALAPHFSHEALGHTYDLEILEGLQYGRPIPPGRWSGATMPTLVLDGGKSPAWMRNGVRAAADALPNARYRTLPGRRRPRRGRRLRRTSRCA